MGTPGNLKFDALLLAGGRSTRFGQDKAFVEWRGRPLYLCQIEKLASLGPGRVWVSANAGQRFEDLPDGCEAVIDERPDLGPLGGLLSVFRRSEAESVLVLGVDLPLMEPAFLRRVLERAGRASEPGDPDLKGAVARSGHYWEPLAAVYPRERFLAALESAASEGRLRLQGILDEAFAAGWIEAFPVAEEDALCFTNLNTPRDLPDGGGPVPIASGLLAESAEARGASDLEVPIRRFRVAGAGGGPEWTATDDPVAAEAPLEIRVNGRSVAVTMRTPGDDEDLALGFLATEGVVASAAEVLSYERPADLDRESAVNTLELRLASEPDFDRLTRHVFTSSSCGVCGKATLDAVFRHFPPLPEGAAPWRSELTVETLLALPRTLRSSQAAFDRTGGLHASAVFTPEGGLLHLREDVGRHNALDKVIGLGMREGIDFGSTLLLVSGRISFELMQKALTAGIPLVAGISAPSSLAVALARRSGQTLVGFLRERGFNHYAGPLGEGGIAEGESIDLSQGPPGEVGA